MVILQENKVWQYFVFFLVDKWIVCWYKINKKTKKTEVLYGNDPKTDENANTELGM